MNTVPELNKATAIAAPDQTRAAAAPRIKLLSHGFCLDHPDPALGEQLMADALGSPIVTQCMASSDNCWARRIGPQLPH